MHFGTSYYPEHYNEDQWIKDARLMQAAGINRVRIGEFAWSRIEPREGMYDFQWLDRAIEIFWEHGISTLLCTCSRTPPPWVFKKYPGIINQRADGQKGYGYRYTVGLLHPEFVEISQRIDRAIIERYSGHKAVIGWQIDNEIGAGNDCFCSHCAGEFKKYLKDKYHTVEELNKKWGAHFWSFAFSDFDEVPLPVVNAAGHPQLGLEYRRFLSKTNLDFTRWRYELLKQLCPDKIITTNLQGFGALHSDYVKFEEYMDVNGFCYYPVRQEKMGFPAEFILDYYRGNREKFLVLEQFTRMGLRYEPVELGHMRLYAYQSIAHGATGIYFFCWRKCRWGYEMYQDGLLSYTGTPNMRYDELAKMGDEIKKLGPLLEDTYSEAEAAILMDYESRWTVKYLSDKNLDVAYEAGTYHKALMKMNIPVDAMDTHKDLSRYRLVIAPRLYCVGEETVRNLREYVKNGGILCLTAPSGVVDPYGKAFEIPQPGPLSELAGIEVADIDGLKGQIELRGETSWKHGDGLEGFCYTEEIHTENAQVLLMYASGWREGIPAITVNQYGKGKVVYCGTALDGNSLNSFVKYLCDLAEVQSIIKTPEGVQAYIRRQKGKRIVYILNYTKTNMKVELPWETKDAFTGYMCREVDVEPLDVRVLVKDI